MDQTRTPLFNQLMKHSSRNPVSFHVPGHKYGEVFTQDARPYFDGILKLDATEISGLDDLHSPEGVIQETEELLAHFHGVKKSYLLINGSAVGNLAMIMAAVKENEKVLGQRNCHKSILNGIHLVKAEPIFLGPDFDEEWGVASGVSLHTVKQGIEEFPDAKAIILTNPNYYGMVNELKAIIELAHSKGIPVLIDEAHGAHFIGGRIFPQSAVHLHADVVVQSAHKTLPAMTMGAYLHFNSDLLAEEDLSKYLQILQSSSPSYPIMATLDIARSYLATYTEKDAIELEKKLHVFRGELQKIYGIKVLSYAGGLGDPLKITIQSTTSLSGFDLQRLLEKEGVFVELADPFNVLLVFPMLKANMEYPMENIIQSIKTAFQTINQSEIKKRKIPFLSSGVSRLAINLTQGKKKDSVRTGLIPLKEAIGKVSAQLVIPYPPGIPVLFPGEIITMDIIDSIYLLIKTGARFQDAEDLREGKIKIIVDA